jgi:hypothetical protein
VGGDGAVRRLDRAGDWDVARLQELLEHRELVLDLEASLERRVRAYAVQLNARLAHEGDRDPYDLSRDEELAAVITLLCEAALDAEEQREDASS